MLHDTYPSRITQIRETSTGFNLLPKQEDRVKPHIWVIVVHEREHRHICLVVRPCANEFIPAGWVVDARVFETSSRTDYSGFVILRDMTEESICGVL